jgi:nitrogen fixation protein FixH
MSRPVFKRRRAITSEGHDNPMARSKVMIMTCCGGAGGREITGRKVFLCLVAFFAIVTGVNAVMMFAAITTFGGVETSSSYQAGLAFSREASSVEAQERLGWQVNVRTPAAAGTTTAVEIVARDRADAPLGNLQIDGRLSHPMDKRADRVLAWREIGPGLFRAEVEHAAGQWDLVVELSQDGSPRFRSRNRLTLH